MVKLTIDGMELQVKDGTTILDAALQAGIHIPTLCYLKNLNKIGACRVCMVEVEGNSKLVTACNTRAVEGMVVHTNSPKVRKTRKINVELILSQHDTNCAICARSGNCSLQKLANDLDILEMPFEKQLPKTRWNPDYPLIRDYKKCIKCMRCVQVCDKIQTLNIWDVAGTGSRTTVDVSRNRRIEEADCALCGQCVTHCPVGALRERDDVDKVLDALADPEKITVVQMAPSVRAAWGEEFGLSREFATAERLVAALRRIGFSYIFDTDFSADLTIMEEGSEFLEKLKNKDKEKISVITLPQSPSAEGYEWLLEPDDSVCYMPDYFPVFSCGNLNHYVQNKIKDVHLATGYVTVSFVVSETGSVGQVAIVKSAGEGAQKERVADAKTAERMDSIAYEVVKNLPDFTPAKWKGKAIEFRLYVKLRFQE